MINFKYILFVVMSLLYFPQKAFSIENHYSELKILEQQAKQGNAKAQFYLGSFYEEGDIVPKDYSKAIEWYTKSANQENAEAQFNLGDMYFKGKGLAQNKFKAKSYFKQSCLNKFHDACDLYNLLYQ